jgi:hypothetical protein
MTHLIEKQIVELRLSHTKDAFEIQQKVSAFCNNQLMPALDDLFSRLAPQHTHIRLDELVIDLGKISEKNLTSKDFLPFILAEIERKIVAQMQDNPEKVVIRNEEKEVFAQWFYFLETGRLPWYAHGISPNFEGEIPKVLARSEAAIVQLRSLLMQHPDALQRLIFQHKSAFLALIAGVYTGKVQTDLVKLVEALPQLSEQKFMTLFWQSVFKHVIFLRAQWASSDLIVRAFGELLTVLAQAPNMLIPDENTEGGIFLLIPNDFPFLKETEDFLMQTQSQNAWIIRKQAIETAKITKAKATVIAKANEEISSFSTKNGENTEGEGAQTEAKIFASKNEEMGGLKADDSQILPQKGVHTEGVDLATTNENDVQMPTLLKSESEQKAAQTAGEIPKEIYISNAGVVLIHPFLSRLFENLGLTTNNIFKNESMRHKALGILHYLATGEEKVAEYNLVLPKLLCQMPLNMPVEGHWVLSKKDKKECDKLLKVAIEYWSALGSTSPAGLREGFLQRKGKLVNRPSGWLLQVERSTIDVLIDRLPWGLGIVKLPWMKEFLTVEW